MKIAICSSMSFAREMLEAKEALEGLGHEIFLPENCGEYADGFIKLGGIEGAQRKIQYDLIKKHWQKIEDSDAILVLNHDKKGIKNYIGGNSFLEIGFAHILGKKIYILNDIPEIEFYYQEIIATQPMLLNGDLNKITEG